LRLVGNGAAEFGYELIEDAGFEELSLGWWRPGATDLAASDWYLEVAYTV